MPQRRNLEPNQLLHGVASMLRTPQRIAGGELANHIGKTADRKPGTYPEHLAQVCDLRRLSQHEIDALFTATPVGRVWGVGPRITEKQGRLRLFEHAPA